MRKFLESLKLMLLLGVLAILGWTALPGTAQADFQEQVVCEGPGHTCHVIVGSTVHHHEKLPETY